MHRRRLQRCPDAKDQGPDADAFRPPQQIRHPPGEERGHRGGDQDGGDDEPVDRGGLGAELGDEAFHDRDGADDAGVHPGGVSVTVALHLCRHTMYRR